MSDEFDQDKNGRRRRRRLGKKEREREREESLSVTPTKTPIILAKPDRVNAAGDSPLQKSSTEDLNKPMFTLKTREDKPTVSSIAAGCSDETSRPASQPIYQLQSRKPSQSSLSSSESSVHSKLSGPAAISRPIKLVDDQFQWSDGAAELLMDQTDYLVIGVLGLQGVGKSTIMSLLAGNKPTDNLRSFMFRPQTPDVTEVGGHQTGGIDLFVTNERVILLDTQPILSASVLDNLIDKKYHPEYNGPETCVEMQSLQLTTFMMTVCHVILIVHDWFIDSNLFRFIQTAEMLKPAMPASHDTNSSEDNSENYSHLVFVQNKAKREDFGPDCLTVMQDVIRKAFENSKLKFRGSVSMAANDVLPCLNHKSVPRDVNLFLFPEIGEAKSPRDAGLVKLLPTYKGHPSPELLQMNFINQLFSVTRPLLTHATLSEKNWFQYSARQWDVVKKSPLLSEYSRLLT